MNSRILEDLFNDYSPWITNVARSKPKNLLLRVPIRRSIDRHFFLNTPCFTRMVLTTDESQKGRDGKPLHRALGYSIFRATLFEWFNPVTISAGLIISNADQRGS